jgi:putative DNA primase/helicase
MRTSQADSVNNALQFFKTLYGEDAPGYLPLWKPRPNSTRWIPTNDLSKIAETAVELGRRGDVYFGLGLHPEDRGPHERGKAEGVIAFPGLWADIDVKGEAHEGENLPPTGEDAMRIIEAFPLSPTSVLHSGHGLQAWWLFEEQWVFGGEEERKKAQNLCRRFQATLKAEANQHGWGWTVLTISHGSCGCQGPTTINSSL